MTVTTFRAFVVDLISVTISIDGNWYHQSLTGCRSVAWIDVNMLAPETFRAMICVSIAVHLISAVFATKILKATGK